MSEKAQIWIDRLLGFMANPASFPHNPETVDIIQTHISIVAIAPPFVYKVKKPLNLGFLDFSTLDKREFYCHEEVRLNSRLTSDVYLGVVPISEAKYSLEFSDSNIVGYAVKMRLLDNEFFLDQLTHAGKISRKQLGLVADRLADFYLAQQPNDVTAKWGRIRKLQISTTENFEQIHSQIGVLITQPAFDALVYFTDRFYDANARLLVKRRAGGFIKDCHGDLHLDHVHIKDGVVNIYDCIEFNERFRYIDVANDIAFLTMDLDHHGRTDLSKTFARNMASRLNDNDLSKLLPFYKCYRAIVRGKVAGMRGMEVEIPADDRRDAIDEGRSYFRQALGYAVTNDIPTVVIVMGGVGTGKSSQAKALAYNLGWEVFSSDVIRKTRAGADLYDRTPDARRDELYDSNESDNVYDELTAKAISSANKGHSCVLDATYGSLERRNKLRALLRREDIEYRFIEITASEDIIRQRLSDREQKDNVVSDARLEDYELLRNAFESPSALEDEFHFCVSSEGSADSTIATTLKALVQLS